MEKREYYTYMILLAWIQVLNYVILVFVCSVVFFCLGTTLCSKKIANYNLYIYTHTAIWGGGGLARHGSSALTSDGTAPAQADGTAWKGNRKTENPKTRNPSSLWCENENKTRSECRVVYCSTLIFFLALFTQHTHKQQEKLWKFN